MNELEQIWKDRPEDDAPQAVKQAWARRMMAHRVRQLKDPDVRAAVPCLRFSPVGDADTPTQCMACDGALFSYQEARQFAADFVCPSTTEPCRCTLELVDVFTLERMDVGKRREAGLKAGRAWQTLTGHGHPLLRPKAPVSPKTGKEERMPTCRPRAKPSLIVRLFRFVARLFG